MWLQKINANIFKRKNKCYPSNRLHKYYLWTNLQNIFKSGEEQLAQAHLLPSRTTLLLMLLLFVRYQKCKSSHCAVCSAVPVNNCSGKRVYAKKRTPYWGTSSGLRGQRSRCLSSSLKATLKLKKKIGTMVGKY